MSDKHHPKAICELRRGDIVTHQSSGEGYVVVRTHPHVLAVRDITVSNPSEWKWFDPDGGGWHRLER
jgi:hypothetical protein